MISFLLISLYSCNNQEESEVTSVKIESIENLINDPSFIAMMGNYSSKNSNILDINLALELTSRDDLSNQEILDLSSALGFSTPEDMLSFFNDQAIFALDIEERYKISTYDIEYLHSILLSDDSAKNSGCIDRCSVRSTNCIVAATATAVVAHLGCATLDITIIAGVICHGAVTANQYIENSNCRLDLEDCIDNCRNSQ